jgi:hypothetical protein
VFIRLKEAWFLMPIPQAIAGLKLAGFDVLSTANNHGFDQGQNGIDFTHNSAYPKPTFCRLAQVLIATTVQIVAKNGIKFGFLAYSYTALNDGGKTTESASLRCQ